ncbi:hypothetical protein [Methanobrevibacter sp.]|mgnify:CR=1 FL=1|uniref:hypothetical protein n=1 Tax=Methanobrevibacter sp. TaxID=66852 RepID=UPI00261B10C7|nr:hypothetical protein [uncultured Methanobrevibacter sp.]
MKSKIKALMVDLFKDKIIINGEKVKIVTEFPPSTKYPCISMNNNGGKGDIETYRTPNGIWKVTNKSFMLHIWSNSNEERDDIVSFVKRTFELAEINHFSTCSNFNENICSINNNICKAKELEITRCPINSYNDPFNNYNIRRNEFEVNGESEQDQIDLEPPIYRTVFTIDYKEDNIVKIRENNFKFNGLNIEVEK